MQAKVTPSADRAREFAKDGSEIKVRVDGHIGWRKNTLNGSHLMKRYPVTSANGGGILDIRTANALASAI